MLPVTIALGLINLSLVINSLFGTLVSDEAPAAIDKAFRIYQLPQGLFSISIATILFPTLARFAARGARDDLRRTMANGVRQISLLLIPSAVLMAVLAEPITRLIYQRGVFGPEATELTSTALFWWSISLPFQGVSLLFSRTFFSLQRPWATTALSGVNLLVNAALAAALYGPLEIAGIVIGTVAGTVVMCVAQGWLLRGELGGVEGGAHAGRQRAHADRGRTAGRRGLRRLVRAGRARSGAQFLAQLLAVLGAIAAGVAVYGAAVWVLRVPEARQIRDLLVSRRRPRGKEALMSPDEKMDVEEQIECLNVALRLQHRSVLHVLDHRRERDRARVPGPRRQNDEARAVGARGRHAPGREDHRSRRRADHRRWPSSSFTPDPAKALERLIEYECEALEALQAAIEPTGREAASEAVEHRLEHMIMRKQEQVDYLLRAQRRPASPNFRRPAPRSPRPPTRTRARRRSALRARARSSPTSPRSCAPASARSPCRSRGPSRPPGGTPRGEPDLVPDRGHVAKVLADPLVARVWLGAPGVVRRSPG